jgi:hypothetical protein
MKTFASFRLLVATLIIVLGVLLIQGRKSERKPRGGKVGNKGKNNPNKTTVSSTEYIFFESLSKNLFLSLQ